MPQLSGQSPAPFASLSAAPVKGLRMRLAQLFTAPFRDIDDRAYRLAEAARREREARQAPKSGEAE